MLTPSIFQNRSGEMGWEIMDDETLYLRSGRGFAQEQDARLDLREESHLIHSYLKSPR